ncbi:hypothetical protein SAMN00808754_2558 [Thermanaeromonas toyohensis ToBE]|uniref:PD(D/E)XK endonuclease domain-containing protein n=1 Tax=Thermanaeromonas toyohensis ToBE TaxID=698762 RepID=A0A1W1VZX4_9FIRM|nr:hypothetical protein [Thermanaeromonas toyohensis]SMB98810.1 hypothetical protein SAMN00808754_2558 [Thermanaeromonas toyohensis ToBE]
MERKVFVKVFGIVCFITEGEWVERKSQGRPGNANWKCWRILCSAELLKRGIIAALAPRNAPSFDVLATHDGRTVKIRVKTKSEENPGWHFLAKKDGKVFRDISQDDDFVILVNLSMDVKNLEFYIIPTNEVNTWLEEDFKRWVESPGKNGRPHDPNNKVRKLNVVEYQERLRKYLNNWDILWQ